ncbi:MAG: hypothetical protein EXR37_09530 [Limnohabitans sp.]|nr:hypothetical protein [Limnohabitans sp.]
MKTDAPAPLMPSTRLLWLTVLLAGLLYVWGMDNLYMPSNGDEMVYNHIARLTAASGQWLPLVSDLNDMRNTKPPLLFWQSMVITGWGQHWQLWLLRLPSLMYLILVCAGMSLLLHRWLSEWRSAAWAVLLMLLSWGTFRYGRPYLTTAPEMFWYSLGPGLVLWRAADAGRRDIRNTPAEWACWTLLGLLTGIGLAYKSFVLVLPVAAGVCLLRLLIEPRRSWRAVAVCTAQTAWMSALALGVFAVWLLIDPQPQEVWREFVQRENAGKMSDSQGYWSLLFSWQGSGDYLSAPLQNTGLLFPWLVVLPGLLWRQRNRAVRQNGEPLNAALLVWIAVWCVVFILPSQRSSRYLLPLMPALAMLMGMHMPSVAKAASLAVGVLSLLMLSVLGWLGWHARPLGLLPDLSAVLLILCLVLVLILCHRICRRDQPHAYFGLLCAMLALLGLHSVLHGMSGERIAFQGQAMHRPLSETVWVPEGFNGEFDRFQFLLPGNNRFVPDQARVNAFSEASASAPGAWFIVARTPSAAQLACETQQRCERIAMRWDIEQRLKPGQVNAGNIARPGEWLWRQEWLLRMR